jgi:hypothetical protein
MGRELGGANAAVFTTGFFVGVFGADDAFSITRDPPDGVPGRGPTHVIDAAWKAGCWAGLSGALAGGLAGALASGPHFAVAGGVIVGINSAVVNGLGFWLYHYWLRCRLSRAGLLPFRLGMFLEWCALPARSWLRVADAYEFRHQDLLDHVATTAPLEGLRTVEASAVFNTPITFFMAWTASQIAQNGYDGARGFLRFLYRKYLTDGTVGVEDPVLIVRDDSMTSAMGSELRISPEASDHALQALGDLEVERLTKAYRRTNHVFGGRPVRLVWNERRAAWQVHRPLRLRWPTRW